jgi:hypothetical protein
VSGNSDEVSLSTDKASIATNNHTLAGTNIPSHDHKVEAVIGTGRNVPAGAGYTVADAGIDKNRATTGYGGSQGHSHSISDHKHGIGKHSHSFSESVNIEPVYYSLAYIIYLGVI